MVDDKTGMLNAVVCKEKGVHSEVVEDVVECIDSLGYKRVI